MDAKWFARQILFLVRLMSSAEMPFENADISSMLSFLFYQVWICGLTVHINLFFNSSYQQAVIMNCLETLFSTGAEEDFC